MECTKGQRSFIALTCPQIIYIRALPLRWRYDCVKLGKRRRLNRKKLASATLHRVVFLVEFSLLLAFLRPLEGSAVESMRGMSLQYPSKQEALYLCNGTLPSLTVEYVTEFSERTDAPEVRCDLTDMDNYVNPRCAFLLCNVKWTS